MARPSPHARPIRPNRLFDGSQIIIAAEITVDSPDFGHLEPMVDATLSELEKAGVSQAPEAIVADRGTGTKPNGDHRQ